MRVSALFIILGALAAGCATPPQPRTETAARVVHKVEHSKLVQMKGMSSSQMVSSLQGTYGARAPVMVGVFEALFTRTRLGEQLGLTQSINVFAYTLRTNDQTELTVLSEYPFPVGACVKVFSIERNELSPAVAYGSGCTAQ